MNYNHFHVITARTESAYTAAQDFIANQCPVLERRIKATALTTAINLLENALIIVDWLLDQIKRLPEYRLRTAIAYIEAKRRIVRQLIAAARLNQRYQLTATAAKLWTRKGAIAQSAMDKVFALN